jgi:hypothetical protein
MDGHLVWGRPREGAAAWEHAISSYLYSLETWQGGKRVAAAVGRGGVTASRMSNEGGHVEITTQVRLVLKSILKLLAASRQLLIVMMLTHRYQLPLSLSTAIVLCD